MSLVVAAYGVNYIALGADHGSWKINDAGEPYDAKTHEGSKLREVPGCPMIFASVGNAGADRFVDRFIERKQYTPQTYRIYDGLKELWAELFDEYDTHARKRLEAAGFDPEKSIAEALESETGDFVTPRERMAAGLTIISAGIDYTGFPRFFSVNYPSREPVAVNFNFTDGGICSTSGVFAMGSHDVLSGFGQLGIDYTKLGAGDALGLCRFMLETVDRAESLREKTGYTRTVMGPFDLALITKSGIEWIAGEAP